jgi:S1-C subfamily serine protease
MKKSARSFKKRLSRRRWSFPYLALILSLALLIVTPTWSRSYESQARAATGAIFQINKDGSHTFHCSGTEIGKTNDGGGIFLTARHCIANPDTNKINDRIIVSFSDNQHGPYYEAQPIALSLDDDLALLYLKNGSDIPKVGIKDERRLHGGDAVFNVSFPLGMGKSVFHGEYMAPSFSTMPSELLSDYTFWIHAMPVNLTFAHGSSGSGIFSSKQRGLIGVAVGTFSEGSYNIAIPSDRVLDFLFDLTDNTVQKFVQANPEKAVIEIL